MTDQNGTDRGSRNQDFGAQGHEGARQQEQFDDSSGVQQSGYSDYDQGGRDQGSRDQWGGGQMGEPSRGGADYYYEEVILMPRRGRGGSRGGYARSPGDRQRGADERGFARSQADRGYPDQRDYAGYGRESGYGPSTARRYSSFTSEDQGGRDFSSPTGRWSSSYAGGAPSGSYSGDYGGGHGGAYRAREDGYSRPQHSDRPRQRDWWDRTTDEVASWFGDEDASRRREMDHRGRGPSDYKRSDERIREDVSDNLTDDWAVDARNVRVKVENGEVTLDGTVATRLQKRRAEDCAEDVSGVTHVQNNLRVKDSGRDETTGGSATSGTTTGKSG